MWIDKYLDIFYKNEKWFLSIRFTLSWVMVGVIAYGFEWIILKYYGIDFKGYIYFLLYTIPPVAVGFPLVLIEQAHLEKHFRKLPFGYFILAKTSLYLFGIILVYFIIWFFLMKDHQHYAFFNGEYFVFKYLFVWGIGTAIIFFFKNMSDHVDRRNLWRWLTGRYFKPVEERRIFLFLDLNHSTAIAETLGHIRYFEFINDFYGITAKVIYKLKGEIYQYVGDEVVISWSIDNGLANNNALNLMFEIERVVQINSNYFLKKYDLIPNFKGSLHFGEVTRGEIGVLKKEFVFSGDVLNTASRMHSLCKQHKVSLVVSAPLLEKFLKDARFKMHYLGNLILRGKREKTSVYGVEKCLKNDVSESVVEMYND